MKTLPVSIRKLALLVLLLCLSGAFAASASAQARTDEIRPADPKAAAAPALVFQPESAEATPFRRGRSPRTGRLRSLSGGRIPLDGASVEQAASAFLGRQGAEFGLDPGWNHRITTRANGRRVHVEFEVDGHPVFGAGAILAAERQALTSVVVEVPASSKRLGNFDRSEAQARVDARAELEQLRQSRGLSQPASWLAAQTRRTWLATADGLVPAWMVEERSATPGEAYALLVDARDGSFLRVVDLVDHGKGWYPVGVTLNKFTTGDGKLNVFKNQADARSGTVTKRIVGQMAKGVPGIAAKGYAISAHADTWDNAANHAFEPTMKFLFDPLGASAPHFDQVNTIYEVEKFYRHVKKAAGGNLATHFALPILLNIESAFPNAFFSPTLFPPDSHVVGYLAFYQMTGTFGLAGDISRDPTVVDHEYTHAWLAFEGLSFNGALDEPSRAVNEAVADFFAVTHHDDTVIGRYSDDVFIGWGIARDLQDDDHYPETTTDAIALTGGNLPEEHRNGEIFGSFLVDVRNQLGGPRTEKLLYKAFPFMPHDMASVGYPSVTPANAVAATETFFHECVLQFRLRTKRSKEIGAIVGAAAARGIQNTPTSSWGTVVDLESVAKRKFRFPSAVVRAGAQQTFLIQARNGRRMTVTLAGGQNTGLTPDFTVTALSGNPSGVAFPNAKVYLDANRVVTQEKIQLNDSGKATYLVTVSGTSGTTGTYKLTLDA